MKFNQKKKTRIYILCIDVCSFFAISIISRFSHSIDIFFESVKIKLYEQKVNEIVMRNEILEKSTKCQCWFNVIRTNHCETQIHYYIFRYLSINENRSHIARYIVEFFRRSIIWKTARFRSHCFEKNEKNLWKFKIELFETQLLEASSCYNTEYFSSSWSDRSWIATYNKYSNLETIVKNSCEIRFIIFQTDERENNRNLNVYLN